jgi:hypothetical protein
MLFISENKIISMVYCLVKHSEDAATISTVSIFFKRKMKEQYRMDGLSMI